MSLIRKVTCKLSHIYYERLSIKRHAVGKVLMLHWVDDNAKESEISPYHISTEGCRKLLKWLNGQNTIRLENWEQEKDFYALSIDDVPENFYHNVYPLLKEMEIPFTIFVNTTLLDGRGYITVDQLKEIARCPLCTVGSHGVSHSLYYKMSANEALKDLQKSKKILETIIDCPVEMYAFPYGSYYACGYQNKFLVMKVYKYGFGTIGAPITFPNTLPNYYLPRINVDCEFIKNIK
ncbi:polysaccharide deacetylase family protein [Bacteroides sp. GM023]|uniref:polysaccharide deacetylase family protein n=1 Tax=Bacteroides sp. GM023 TaxID=2723058 RepID=UPI00168A4F2D|nr:polysaccharide deacetylase family protein [Bacteroides sp. GM023]MBD3589418.1 polysaccharide deacetylase family protein [Bacteroides sp. GM023]